MPRESAPDQVRHIRRAAQADVRIQAYVHDVPGKYAARRTLSAQRPNRLQG
ncbi:hypothetical protein ACLMAL_30085 [Nocardia sp. CWNU-33]|uniref:hypothetical protein n=1 Tax=Nocardia sp. CWNU-33 TaxID=3392117 RepID=UPI00398F567C